MALEELLITPDTKTLIALFVFSDNEFVAFRRSFVFLKPSRDDKRHPIRSSQQKY